MPKISELPAGTTALTGTEQLAAVQSSTKQFTPAQIATYAGSPSGAFVDGTDIYAALTAAIAALGSNGGIINIPAGTYTCSATITLTKPINLRGASSFGNASVATKITWPANTTGILVAYPFQGIGSIIEKIAMFGTLSGSTTGHGIEMRATCTIRDMQINNFKQQGIRIFGDIGGGFSNCNGFHLNSVVIQGCGGDGVYCSGGDSNAGVGILVTCLDNGGWGINDDCFLGNTWVACQTDSNASGPYTTSQVSARSSYFGCYSEGNQTPSVISQWSAVIGGLHAAGVIGGFHITNDEIGPHYQLMSDGQKLVAVGTSATTLFDLSSPSPSADFTTQFLKYVGGTGWGVGHANLDGRYSQFWTTSDTTVQDYFTSAAISPAYAQVLFPNAFYVAGPSGKFIKQFTLADAGASAAPMLIDLGPSYADSQAASKAKLKLYHSTTGDVHGFGITTGSLDGHVPDTDKFSWCWAGTVKLISTKTVFSPAVTNGMALGSASLLWSDIYASRVLTPMKSTLTIASGVVTVTGGYHTVDTEASAASDDLDTISGGVDGARLVIRANNTARTVVCKDGTGNLKMVGDFSLDNTEDTIEFVYDGTLTAWLELGRSDNGA